MHEYYYIQTDEYRYTPYCRCGWVGTETPETDSKKRRRQFVSHLEALAVEEPEHQHQFLPWLTLPNGSSFTACATCDWTYQYDH